MKQITNNKEQIKQINELTDLMLERINELTKDNDKNFYYKKTKVRFDGYYNFIGNLYLIKITISLCTEHNKNLYTVTKEIDLNKFENESKFISCIKSTLNSLTVSLEQMSAQISLI